MARKTKEYYKQRDIIESQIIDLKQAFRQYRNESKFKNPRYESKLIRKSNRLLGKYKQLTGDNYAY